MLGTTIVPERDRMRFPAEAHMKMRILYVLIEEFQNVPVFAFAQPVNVARKTPVDVDDLA